MGRAVVYYARLPTHLVQELNVATVPNNQNTPYLRSYGHFQMTLFDQRVNIKIIFSFYSIYITYLIRSEDLTPR